MILLNNSLNADFLRCGNGVVVVKKIILVLERYMLKYLWMKYDGASLLSDCLAEQNCTYRHRERESSRCSKMTAID